MCMQAQLSCYYRYRKLLIGQIERFCLLAGLIWSAQGQGYTWGLSQTISRGDDSIDLLSEPRRVAVSSDNQYVGVIGSDGVKIFHRHLNGSLECVEAITNEFCKSLTFTPDNQQVFMICFNPLDYTAFFDYFFNNGVLTLNRAYRFYEDGLVGLRRLSDVIVSPDNQQVFLVSGTGALGVFDRFPNNGTLRFNRIYRDGESSVSSSVSAAVSLDNKQVFLVSGYQKTLNVFDRFPNNGTLSFNRAFQDGVNGVDGLSYAASVTVSPDDRQVFVASSGDDALTVFDRFPGNGTLSFNRVFKDGVNGVDGLRSATSVVVSPNGQQVLVVSNRDNDLVVFDRVPSNGGMSFNRVIMTGINRYLSGKSVAISPDGRQIFVTSYWDDALVVLDRTPENGDISFNRFYQDSPHGIGVLEKPQEAAFSSDSQQMFVAVADGYFHLGDEALKVFNRTTGNRMHCIQVLKDGKNGVDGLYNANSVAISSDNQQVFVTSRFNKTLSIFDRFPSNGTLSFNRFFKDSVNGVDGLVSPSSVAVSPDNRQVFVTSGFGDALAVFDRFRNGTLNFNRAFKDGVNGVDGLDNAIDVAVSPDNLQVFVASFRDNALAVFDRYLNNTLSFNQVFKAGVNGVDGLNSARSVAISPDGRQVFVASSGTRNPDYNLNIYTGYEGGALAVFDRDPNNGTLSFNQAFKSGVNGVDELSGANSVAVSPDGRNVFVTSSDSFFSANGALVEFSRNPDTGELNIESVFKAGDLRLRRPQHLSFSPDGQLLAISGEEVALLQSLLFELPFLVNVYLVDSSGLPLESIQLQLFYNNTEREYQLKARSGEYYGSDTTVTVSVKTAGEHESPYLIANLSLPLPDWTPYPKDYQIIITRQENCNEAGHCQKRIRVAGQAYSIINDQSSSRTLYPENYFIQQKGEVEVIPETEPIVPTSSIQPVPASTSLPATPKATPLPRPESPTENNTDDSLNPLYSCAQVSAQLSRAVFNGTVIYQSDLEASLQRSAPPMNIVNIQCLRDEQGNMQMFADAEIPVQRETVQPPIKAMLTAYYQPGDEQLTWYGLEVGFNEDEFSGNSTAPVLVPTTSIILKQELSP